MKSISPIRSIAVFMLAILMSADADAAEAFSPSAAESLSQSEKLSRPQELLAPFYDGADKIKVIVTLKPSAKAQTLSSQSAAESTVPPEFNTPNAGTYYDLNNPVIRNQLVESVAQKLEGYSATLDKSAITVTHKFKYIYSFAAEVTFDGLEQLNQDPEVQLIEEDITLYPHLSQGIPVIHALNARSTYNGSGISIAVTDTGIDTMHPRLGGAAFPNTKVIGGYDFGMNDSDPTPAGNAHGTSVAGIAAGDLGTVGDYIGGVASGAKLYALKISNDTNHSASSADMIEAWEWALTHKNDDSNNPILVVNTSFGGGRYTATCDSASSGMTQAAANAVAAGISIFVSSGNDGFCDATGWPACITHVNSVGAVYDANIGTPGWCVSSYSCAPGKFATGGCSSGYAAYETSTSADKVTLYSNSASFLTIFASSNNAYTTDITGSGGYSSGDYTTSFGGTSAASPYAAGAAAVLQHAAKTLTGNYLTPAQVKNYFTSTGNNITDTKVAITKPRVNLENAVYRITHPPVPPLDDDFLLDFLPQFLGN